MSKIDNKLHILSSPSHYILRTESIQEDPAKAIYNLELENKGLRNDLFALEQRMDRIEKNPSLSIRDLIDNVSNLTDELFELREEISKLKEAKPQEPEKEESLEKKEKENVGKIILRQLEFNQKMKNESKAHFFPIENIYGAEEYLIKILKEELNK